jgi:hypothetical protein
MTQKSSQYRGIIVTPATRQLIRRHFHQIINRGRAEHEDLCNTFAITFRPGDRSANFLGKEVRPVGAAVLVALAYGQASDSSRRSIPVRGFRAAPRPDGSVSYGGDNESVFDFDAASVPRPGARSKTLDPARNPSIVELVQRMDRTCQNQAVRCGKLPRVPRLPRILLGFPPGSPPAYEETPALRRAAAKALGVPLDRLGTNGSVLMERLLRDTWEQSFIPADAMGNTTGHLLISAELCTQARQALRIYEDFSELLGLPTWNPAREVTPLELCNPALAVLEAFDVDLKKPSALEDLTQDKLDAMQLAMRAELGTTEAFLSEAEICDALVCPEKPIAAWRCALSTLRGKLSPYVSECTTDEDLLQAARQPHEPLLASGGCRIFVLERASSYGLNFDSDRLGRRVQARLDRSLHVPSPQASFPVLQST